MNTQLLEPRDLDRAAEIIRSGGLVGIPTETVYGLGADGLNPVAVRSIFQAKGRPQDNPLILHIADATWLERYCEDIPETAWRLAKRFWPGPLTMILKCKRRTPEDLEELKRGPVCSATHFGPRVVPDVVTAGLDTVGMPTSPPERMISAARSRWGCAVRPTPFAGLSLRRRGDPLRPPRATCQAGQVLPQPDTCWTIWTGGSTPFWTEATVRWEWSPPLWT